MTLARGVPPPSTSVWSNEFQGIASEMLDELNREGEAAQASALEQRSEQSLEATRVRINDELLERDCCRDARAALLLAAASALAWLDGLVNINHCAA